MTKIPTVPSPIEIQLNEDLNQDFDFPGKDFTGCSFYGGLYRDGFVLPLSSTDGTLVRSGVNVRFNVDKLVMKALEPALYSFDLGVVWPDGTEKILIRGKIKADKGSGQ